jgi:alcohol dehydrogenase (cytochrome c)
MTVVSRRIGGHRRDHNKINWCVVLTVYAAIAITGAASTFGQVPTGPKEPTWSRLEHGDKEPQNWLTYFGNNRAWSYSPLNQITRENVRNLLPAWAFSAGSVEGGLVSTPLVMDGVMYLPALHDRVFALDAATGKQIWSYNHEMETRDVWVPYNTNVTRGLALGYGLVYVGTRDNHLVAIDQKTGREVWDVEVEDEGQCFCNITSAPIVVKDKVIVGGTGGDVPHRGYLTAFDAKTGKEVWRFFVIPGPGESSFGSWQGDSWALGGGSPWFTGSYDPELNLVYWGTGNASNDFLGDDREGDNLYTSSLVAIDADTGKLKWAFQETPHDTYDYDAIMEPLLLDVDQNGKKQQIVLHTSKNGFAFVYDRATGKFLKAWPFVDTINWTKGIDKDGKPIGILALSVGQSTLLCPSLLGGRNWPHSAYSPRTGWWYNTGWEYCSKIAPDKSEPLIGAYWAAFSELSFVPPPDGRARGHIDAFDPLTGRKQWSFPTTYLSISSLLATGGDLIFSGDIEGDALALDAKTGQKLWSFNIGSSIASSPMSYSVNGKQYVAIGSGARITPPLVPAALFPERKGRMPQPASTLFVFALPNANNQGSTQK